MVGSGVQVGSAGNVGRGVGVASPRCGSLRTGAAVGMHDWQAGSGAANIDREDVEHAGKRSMLKDNNTITSFVILTTQTCVARYA